MKQALFLYNPQSGTGRIERKVTDIVDVFQRNGYRLEPLRIDFTQNPFVGREEIVGEMVSNNRQ